ncbi:photolyase/cryptochrome alpha/beta domain-containing protein [Haematococcus lacustris]|uniref:Photolyase/cryptochrome alpha/beta domain-containing protein n=1 Tax=Haematococcus lacustris TaxID=44745 RepID=A0A699Y909_HAELA|nr:photolyase/cryptochrome alpha/beta domain-containing protein [Haematococcus lacustris]
MQQQSCRLGSGKRALPHSSHRLDPLPSCPFCPLLPCCRHLPRAQFLLESVADLKQQLRKLGSDLAVTVGKPEHILPGLLMGCPSSLVLTMEESTSEEKTVDAAVVKALDPAGSRLQKVWGHTLYHLDDLQGNGGPFSSGGIKTMPNIFTPFKEQVERRCQVRALAPTPSPGSLPLPDPAAPVASGR